ncbi:hypothetical protein Q3G72_031156 [Acer saccharum]|nr:hypothetical protein Q3G72_031156 [Acer saccharum]
MMGLRIQVFLLSVWFQFLIIAAVTYPEDAAILKSLKDIIEDGLPPNWLGSDPCGDQWEGIECTRSRVTTIRLSSMGLTGSLSGDITSLSELLTLDLSNNKDLKGSLPSSIGDLKKLKNLILVGCNLFGPIPDSIGSLQQLVFLSLNSNSFSGKIPASIGNLSNLYWLDLTDNQLDGTIPVSDGVSPGLDMLVSTRHLLFNRNQLTGPLPSSLGLVKTLEVVRFDRNLLSGTVPSNLNNLTNLNALFLSNNRLTGPIPNLTNLTSLSYLDMSNNTFDPSPIPSWFSTLQSLTTLPPEEFRPLFFNGDEYLHFTGENRRSVKSTGIGVIIGTTAGVCVLLLLLVLAGVYAYRQKRRAEKANDQNPFAHWDRNKSSGSIPQLKGARCFSFEELNKYTNHFSDTNNVGSGGYGKVYRATLPSGQLIAIKRAQQGSMQGEQILIYEYIPNGSLRDSLSGKSGIRLEWEQWVIWILNIT